MGTKNNPGTFDCYANAGPDEPMFILLGRDPMAPSLVDMWATAREAYGEGAAKVSEAQECAASMRTYLEGRGKREVAVAGDFTSQSTAWLAVFDLCCSLGMKTGGEESGVECVQNFIRALAAKTQAEGYEPHMPEGVR